MKYQIRKFFSKTYYFVISILVLIMITIAAGYSYYSNESKIVYKKATDELKTISKLKVDQIVQWLSERNAEIDYISGNISYKNNIDKLLKNKNNKNIIAFLRNDLSNFQNNNNYENIAIISNKYEIIFLLNETKFKFSKSEKMFVDSAITGNKIIFTDFYKCEILNEYHLDIIAPITNDENNVIAIILFRLNPDAYLFPLIQSWPIPSETSETILVRKEIDSVVFINELRHIKQKPNSIKISLSQNNLPAVQAVKGNTGIWDGIDYRGVNVLAKIEPIPGTNWYMITKVDKEEILQELYDQYLFLVILITLIILIIIAGGVIVYAYFQREIYKKLWKYEEEFKTALYSIGDGVITTDKKGRVKYINKTAEYLTGWNLKDASGKNLTDIYNIINEISREKLLSPVQKVLDKGQIIELENHTILISKSGKEIPIADTGSPIKDENGNITGVVLAFRDKTDEINRIAKVKESEKKYRQLFGSIQDAILVADTDRNIIDCNEAFTNNFGYNFDEIKDKKTVYLYENENQFIELGNALKVNINRNNFRYTVNYRRKNGSVFPGETAVFYLKDENEKINGFIGLIRDVSERLEKEKEILYWQELMSYVIKHDPNSIAVFDNKMRYIFASARYLVDYKISFENIIGKIHYEVFPEIGDNWKKVHKRALSGETVSAVDDEFLRQDGKKDYVCWECRPWYKTNNEIGGIILYSEVVTKRKEIENELRLNQERFRSIVEGAPDPIFIQTQLKFAYLNPAACRLFGIINPSDLIGKPILERFHPKYHEKILERVHQLNVKGERVEELSEIIIRLNGEERWVETTGEPILYEDNYGALVFLRDTTEKKESEKQLRAKEELLRLSTELANVAVWEFDFLKNCMARSKNHDKLYGLDWIPEWKFENFLNATHPEDRSYSNEIIQKSASPGGPTQYSFDFRVIYPDSSVHWLNVVGEITDRDSNGNGILAKGILIDITERKKAEEELKQLKDELVVKVGQQTKELKDRVTELERFHAATINRELRMKELKDEIKKLKGK